MKSYLPALKDKHGNRFIGVMGQFHDEEEARTKLYADGLFYAVYGGIPDGIVEFDDEVGLENAPCTVTVGPFPCQAAVIAGPMFDEAVRRSQV